MATVKILLTAALACGAAAAIGSPALAGGASVPAAAMKAQDRAINEKMLAVLLQRRSAVVAATGNEEGRRSALEFLDRRIAKVRAELGT